MFRLDDIHMANVRVYGVATVADVQLIGRGVVPLRHLRHVPPPQYCDCGPDWPLLFKVHEI